MDAKILQYQQYDFTLSPSQRDLQIDKREAAIGIQQQQIRQQQNDDSTLVEPKGQGGASLARTVGSEYPRTITTTSFGHNVTLSKIKL